MSATAVATPQPNPIRPSSGFIVGPVYDSIFIIGSPLLTLLIAIPLFAFDTSYFSCKIMGKTEDLRELFIVSFINAHLVLVFFRSHGNIQIFRTHFWRFTLVPLTMIAATMCSRHLLAVFGIVAVWWDVYHSSLQTFGFGRIYDAKQHNNASAGRLLDIWMNLFMYTGPILAGAHFVDHVRLTHRASYAFAIDNNLLSDLFGRRLPEFLLASQKQLTVAIFFVGVPFVCYYLYRYYQLQQQGYRVSWQKIWLYIITGSVSIYVWGFRSFFDAFWIMNFFHALQYFAIVLFVEQKSLTRLFRVNRLSFGIVIASVWVIALCFLYGLWSSVRGTGSWIASIAITTSIMHFWYDGFIWSVKKQQV